MGRQVLIVANMQHPLLYSTFSDFPNVRVVGPLYKSNSFLSVLVNSFFFLFVIFQFVICKRGRYKAVDIHYPNVRFLAAFFFLLLFRMDVKLSLWGSDVLKVSGFRRAVLGFMMRHSSAISVASSSMADLVIDSYGCARAKIYVAPFCIPQIEEYLKDGVIVRHCTNQQFINVLCGTNGSDNQQFPGIVSAINALSASVFSSARFLFHMGYGGDKTRFVSESVTRDAVIAFDNNFYQGSDLLEFRRTIQVLIQVQKTDQLSAAMIEHLALGAVVITGSWLPYKGLLDAGVFLYLIDDLDDLSSAIEDVINRYDFYASLCVRNKHLLSESFSKFSVNEMWNNFLNSGF